MSGIYAIVYARTTDIRFQYLVSFEDKKPYLLDELDYLKNTINVWIRCGKWKVETVERVTRKQFDW